VSSATGGGLVLAAGLFDGASAGRGAFYTHDAILLATQAVIVDEELFEFLLELAGQDPRCAATCA